MPTGFDFFQGEGNTMTVHTALPHCIGFSVAQNDLVSAKDKRAVPFVEAVRTIKANRPRTLWQLRGSFPVFNESFLRRKDFIMISINIVGLL